MTCTDCRTDIKLMHRQFRERRGLNTSRLTEQRIKRVLEDAAQGGTARSAERGRVMYVQSLAVLWRTHATSVPDAMTGSAVQS
jgi:hypothetical protein